MNKQMPKSGQTHLSCAQFFFLLDASKSSPWFMLFLNFLAYLTAINLCVTLTLGVNQKFLRQPVPHATPVLSTDNDLRSSSECAVKCLTSLECFGFYYTIYGGRCTLLRCDFMPAAETGNRLAYYRRTYSSTNQLARGIGYRTC